MASTSFAAFHKFCLSLDIIFNCIRAQSKYNQLIFKQLKTAKMVKIAEYVKQSEELKINNQYSFRGVIIDVTQPTK
jgi:hypothetical protein